MTTEPSEFQRLDEDICPCSYGEVEDKYTLLDKLDKEIDKELALAHDKLRKDNSCVLMLNGYIEGLNMAQRLLQIVCLESKGQ